jgi:hypothetical protein
MLRSSVTIPGLTAIGKPALSSIMAPTLTGALKSVAYVGQIPCQ